LSKIYLDTISDFITSKVYCDFLDKALPAIRQMHHSSFLYQHDGVPVHRAAPTIAFLKKEDIKVLSWPAQSPDLNPLEHIWLWKDTKMKTKTFENIEELTQSVFDL